MILTLIRHGVTEGSRNDLYYGTADIPLDGPGEAELRELAARYAFPRAQRYYTSGLLRTEQTFAILYGDTPHTALPALREQDFGDWEMWPAERVEATPEYTVWRSGDWDENPCPHGESFHDMCRRVTAAVRAIVAAGEDTVCVVHGGVTCAVLKAYFPVPGEKRYARAPKPGTGYQIEFDGVRAVGYWPIP